jgi:hypothetical protein
MKLPSYYFLELWITGILIFLFYFAPDVLTDGLSTFPLMFLKVKCTNYCNNTLLTFLFTIQAFFHTNNCYIGLEDFEITIHFVALNRVAIQDLTDRI